MPSNLKLVAGSLKKRIPAIAIIAAYQKHWFVRREHYAGQKCRCTLRFTSETRPNPPSPKRVEHRQSIHRRTLAFMESRVVLVGGVAKIGARSARRILHD